LYNYCIKHKLLIFTHYDQYRRSLSGDKIKGFNYGFIRLLIVLFLPLREKIKIFLILIKNI